MPEFKSSVREVVTESRGHTGGVGGQIFWLLLSQSGRGEKVLSLLAAFSGVAYFA